MTPKRFNELYVLIDKAIDDEPEKYSELKADEILGCLGVERSEIDEYIKISMNE